jgi:hypothetical protein
VPDIDAIFTDSAVGGKPAQRATLRMDMRPADQGPVAKPRLLFFVEELVRLLGPSRYSAER